MKRVYMFKPRFAPLVEAGKKNQTVRPRRKHPTKPGDIVSLREWTGVPRRSKQRLLRESKTIRVATCEVTETGVIVDSYAEPSDDFARADGFADFIEMREWFRENHGLPFLDGEVVFWEPPNTEKN